MITVYGGDWCEDTRRSLRHLRRLGVPHQYLNVDEDLDFADMTSIDGPGDRPDEAHRTTWLAGHPNAGAALGTPAARASGQRPRSLDAAEPER